MEEEKPNNTLKEKLLMAQEILKLKLQGTKKWFDEETSYKAECLKSKAMDFNDRFRNKAKAKEGKLNTLRDQYAHLQGVYVENLRALESELELIQNKIGGVNYTRENENSIFHEDLLDLKKRVSDYEAYIKRLKELVDTDRAEELIDELSSNDEKRLELIEIKNQIFRLKDKVGLSKENRIN